MSPHNETKKLLVWSDDIEPEALAQAERASRLPFVVGHVALMPDAHFGKGACVGSVIPTAGAIIPAAVGVDIGCGMVAVQTHQSAADLPDSLDALMSLTEARIPAGLGEGNDHRSDAALAWFGAHDRSDFDAKQERTTVQQFGTLGSGNHFVEVCTDEADGVWLVLHSGSRGIGNRLAQKHIKIAQRIAETYFIPLEDPDLAYLPQGTPEFKVYIDDLMWAQAYAAANREQMMDELVRSLAEILGLTPDAVEADRINCHHNYTAMGDRTWNSSRAEDLIDEHPDAYKDIDTVMANQADLVAIEHTLSQIFNYKG